MESSWSATASIPDADDNASTPRPCCALCGHPLTAARSLARGMGPTCWGRTARAQLDARRDAVGRLLARLARRVASLDVEGLAIIAASAGDALEAIDAEGVTP